MVGLRINFCCACARFSRPRHSTAGPKHKRMIRTTVAENRTLLKAVLPNRPVIFIQLFEVLSIIIVFSVDVTFMPKLVGQNKGSMINLTKDYTARIYRVTYRA